MMTAPAQYIRFHGAVYRLAANVASYDEGLQAFRDIAVSVIKNAKKAEQAAAANKAVADVQHEAQTMIGTAYKVLKDKKAGATKLALQYLNYLKTNYEQKVGSDLSDPVYSGFSKMIKRVTEMTQFEAGQVAGGGDAQIVTNILGQLNTALVKSSQDIGTTFTAISNAFASVVPLYKQLQDPKSKEQIKQLATNFSTNLTTPLQTMLTQIQQLIQQTTVQK